METFGGLLGGGESDFALGLWGILSQPHQLIPQNADTLTGIDLAVGLLQTLNKFHTTPPPPPGPAKKKSIYIYIEYMYIYI